MMNGKRVVLIVVIFLLIGSLAIGLNFYIKNRVDKQMIVGEIVHVRYKEIDQYDECFIYIKPQSDIERNDWVLFKLTKETEGLSETESGIIADSEEIKVGNVVEIVFDKNFINRTGRARIEAISIKSASDNSITTEDLSLVASDKYSFDQGEVGTDIIGEVVHVAKVNISDREGYILYVDDGSLSKVLTEVWIDSKTVMDEEMSKILLEESTGYEVRIKPINAFPFEKNIYTALVIEINNN